MLTRTYSAGIVGGGTLDDPYRSALADYGVNCQGSIETDDLGKPLGLTSVVSVTATEEKHAELRRIAGVVEIV